MIASIYRIFLLFIFICSGGYASGQNDTLRANDLYYDGKDLYYDGNYPAAKKHFTEALELFLSIFGEQHERTMKAYYHLGKTERRLINYQASLIFLQKARSIAGQVMGKESEDYGYILQAIGNSYDNFYRPKEATAYFKKSIEVFEQVYGKPSLEVGGAYMNLGLSATDKGLYQQAEGYYQKAMENFKASVDPDHKAFNKIYINWSDLNRKLGDYDKAIEYGKKALAVKLKNYKETHPSVPKYFGNIGRAYQQKGAYKEALPYFEKMLELSIRSVGMNHPSTGGSYADLGAVYVSMGDYQRGLQLYQKGAAIMARTVPPENPYRINIQYNIAKVHEVFLKNYDKALAIYQQGLDQSLSRPFTEAKYLASTKRRIAKVHYKKGDVETALLHVQEALRYLASGWKPQTGVIYDNPALDQTEDYIEFLKLLEFKSELLQHRYRKNQQIEDLKNSLTTIDLAVALVEKMRKSYLSEDARQYLNAYSKPIYEQAVARAFEQYEHSQEDAYLYQAFLFSEKNKSSILWQTVNEKHAIIASDIPQENLDRINTLYQKITLFEDQLSDASPESSEIDSLRNKVFDLKFEYEKQIRFLELHYPDYYHLKYAPASIRLEDIFSALKDKNTALVEYYYTDQDVYAFTINRQQLNGVRTRLSSDLKNTIHQLRKNSIEYIALNQQSAKDYIRTINKLHTLLIKPIQPLISTAESWIIIPHNSLQYVSFEMLTGDTHNTKFKNLDYLLYHYDIQYAWSAALWLKRPEKSTAPELGFAGFAPGFLSGGQQMAYTQDDFTLSRNSLNALPHSISEVQEIEKLFPGKIYTHEAATESQFIRTASKGSIIHLATHGLVNDRAPMQSGLFFSTNEEEEEDGFLTAAEIYNLRLNAKLAVMSACNTGFGQVAEGEGVMSLGRAFIHAGCESVMMNLWPANDESTSIILKDFYKYYAEGLSKSKALRLAKLDYLKSADPLTAHPFFWANMVAVGDMSPLNKRDSLLAWSPFLILPFGLFLFWYQRKKKIEDPV